MRAGGLLSAAAAAGAALAGCGSSAPPPATAPASSGYFVGRGGDLGAAVDFVGFDATSQAVAAALAGGDALVAVGVASVVNDADRPRPVPVFRAVGADGRVAVLPDARTVLMGRRDPRGRAALALLPPPAPVVPADGSVTVYLVLRGRRPGDLAGLRMRSGPGDAVRLRPERR